MTHPPFTLATACSGIDAPAVAVKRLGIPFTYLFASETDAHCARIIETSPVPPRKLLGDFTQSRKGLPPADLFVCGFPCQPHSGLNNNPKLKGLASDSGKVFFAIREYISEAQPKMFLLENVAMLCSTPAWADITRELGEIHDPQAPPGTPAYTLEWRILNPESFGFCQSRKRVFLIGRHCRKMGDRADVQFPWPTPDSTVYKQPLSDALLPNSQVRRLEPSCYRPLSKCAHAKVETLQQRLVERGVTWSSRRPYLVHPHVSADRLRLNKPDRCLCLSTKCQGFWLIGRERYLSSAEALRVQGFDPEVDFDSTVLESTSRTERYRMAGNSMHVGLLQLILGAVLTTSGDMPCPHPTVSIPQHTGEHNAVPIPT